MHSCGLFILEGGMFSQLILLHYVKTPCKILEHYHNSLWDKSNPMRVTEEEKKNALNCGHLVPRQGTQAARTNNYCKAFLENLFLHSSTWVFWIENNLDKYNLKTNKFSFTHPQKLRRRTFISTVFIWWFETFKQEMFFCI